MAENLAFEHLAIRREGHLLFVELARPAVANALNPAHLQDIEALSFALRDDSARAIVFTGQGKHFSSGADLTAAAPDPLPPLELRRRHVRIGERAIQALLNIDQITIAAWNGAAVGGGACITTAMDFRIGASDCFMSYPEIDIGINLMWKSLPLIVDMVGAARAKRLVIGGERIYAEELLQWGVLDKLVEPENLLASATEMAHFYATKAPIAAQMIKRSVNTLATPLGNAIMHMDSDQNLLASQTEDRASAIKAYLEKSDPAFSGN